MHMLIREVAADILRLQPAGEEDCVISAFVGVTLSRGEELSSLQQTAFGEAAFRRTAAVELLQLETPNFLAMLHLLADDHEPRCKILEEDSKQARDTAFAVLPLVFDAGLSASLGVTSADPCRTQFLIMCWNALVLQCETSRHVATS